MVVNMPPPPVEENDVELQAAIKASDLEELGV
jgi:hypothetical protein